MRLFDDDRIGCYLDHIDHRVEKTKGGEEVKMLDLTLRVQPFTADLAVSFDPDVRALLFTMSDGEPKPKIKSLEFALTIPRQLMKVHLLPESDVASQAFLDVEITQPRAHRKRRRRLRARALCELRSVRRRRTRIRLRVADATALRDVLGDATGLRFRDRCCGGDPRVSSDAAIIWTVLAVLIIGGWYAGRQR